MPDIAWVESGETRSYADIAALTSFTGAMNGTAMPDFKTLELRRGYYAAVSYTDFNIGAVLSVLNSSGLAPSTVVTFWGDHGWSLGEHGKWDKHSNFDQDTHAPLMFRVPGLTDLTPGRGVHTRMVTSHVDIFASLVDFALNASLPTCAADSSGTRLCTEGLSVRPLVARPETPLKLAAFSVYNRGVPHGLPRPAGEIESGKPGFHPTASTCLTGRGNGCVMGYTMLTRIDEHEYRYTEWAHFRGPKANVPWHPNWQKLYGTELYNHSYDPAENRNLFEELEGSGLAAQLRARLRRQWL